jgi:cell division protein FtsX
METKIDKKDIIMQTKAIWAITLIIITLILCGTTINVVNKITAAVENSNEFTIKFETDNNTVQLAQALNVTGLMEAAQKIQDAQRIEQEEKEK